MIYLKQEEGWCFPEEYRSSHLPFEKGVINEKNNEEVINPENNIEQELHKDANLEKDNKEIIDNNIY